MNRIPISARVTPLTAGVGACLACIGPIPLTKPTPARGGALSLPVPAVGTDNVPIGNAANITGATRARAADGGGR